jgi:hypothetical protein
LNAPEFEVKQRGMQHQQFSETVKYAVRGVAPSALPYERMPHHQCSIFPALLPFDRGKQNVLSKDGYLSTPTFFFPPTHKVGRALSCPCLKEEACTSELFKQMMTDDFHLEE